MSQRFTGRTPAAAVAALLASVALAACGGDKDGGSGDAPSKQDYYGSIDGFCRDVKGAANKVQADAGKLQKQAPSDPTAAVKGFGASLQTFADATRKATDRLRDGGAPDEFKDFNTKAVTAFEGVATKLGQAADSAKSGKISALSQLGTDLGSVKLPDLPKDVRANAKACADISS